MPHDIQTTRVHHLPKRTGELRITFDDQQQPSRLCFACPCGCEGICGITLKPLHENGWTHDGNLEAITCQPSIRIFPSPPGSGHLDDNDQLRSCPGWHGHLVAGVFKPCDDCPPGWAETHQMTGETSG